MIRAFYLLLLFYIAIEKTIAITEINFIASSENGAASTYPEFRDEFNKYAEENNLNIKIHLNLFSAKNMTNTVNDYESMLESLLRKHSNKYDIYFFDSVYTTRFGDYLLNIDDILEEEQFNYYKEGIGSKSCIYKNHWISLPVNIDFAVLYSNKNYMKKYNITTIPTTWDELYNVSKYIVEEEARNNTKIDAYNGLFVDSEGGFCSLIELIYSFRKTKDSPFPEIKSKETINALQTAKKFIDDFHLEKLYMDKDSDYFSKLLNGNFLFLKYWYFPFVKQYNMHNVTLIPGVREGISGTTIGGYNVGIAKHLSKTKKEAAIKVFKFITTKEMQKKLILKYSITSGIPSVYNDEEICNKVDCDFINSFQLVARPGEINYDEYSENFRKYIFDYLYNNAPLSEVLQKVVDLNKIYSVTLDTDETKYGFIFFIVIIISSLIEISSLVFLFIEKFKPKFEFLSKDLWFLIIIGSEIILYSNLFKLGEIKSLNCQGKSALLLIGNALVFIPILYKLISNFPLENNKSKWITENKNIFIYGLLLIEVILISFTFISPYDIEMIYIKEGKNFQKCVLNGGFNLVSIILVIISQLLIMICILILSFLEWNIETTAIDIRFITLSIYTDVLFILGLTVTNFTKINNYEINFIISNIIYIGISLSSFIFLYGYRIIFGFMKSNGIEDDIKLYKKSTGFVQSTASSVSKDTSTTSNRLENKILNLHYMKSSNSNGSGSLCNSFNASRN